MSDMSRPDALSTPGARVAAAGVLVSAVLSYRGRQSAGCRAVRGRRACRVRRGRLGGQTGCVGGVGRVPKASEVEVGHSEPWIETSCWRITFFRGGIRSRGPRQVLRNPDVRSALVWLSFTWIWGESYTKPTSWPSPISRPPPPQGAPHSGERSGQIGHVDPLRGPRRAGEPASSSQGHEPHPAAASVRKRRAQKFTTTRLTTLTAPASSTPRKPTAAPTRTPGASHGLVGPRGACGAHSARTSPGSGGLSRAAWNTVRHCESTFVSRTGPVRFDAWSLWCGQAGRVLGLHPRARGRRVGARRGTFPGPGRGT